MGHSQHTLGRWEVCFKPQASSLPTGWHRPTPKNLAVVKANALALHIRALLLVLVQCEVKFGLNFI